MEHIKGFLKEFKEFALKGNVLDMAIGVIIGIAFNAIVGSLVNDIIMPLIAMIFGEPNFNAIVIGQIFIGNFISNVLHFLIISLSLFITLKFILRHKTSSTEISPTP